MDAPRSYITVYESIGGWKAVMMWWNPKGEHWEPWTTGVGAHRTREEAMVEARDWAQDEEIELREAT